MDLDGDEFSCFFFKHGGECFPWKLVIFLDDSAMLFGDCIIRSISDGESFGDSDIRSETLAGVEVFIVRLCANMVAACHLQDLHAVSPQCSVTVV